MSTQPIHTPPQVLNAVQVLHQILAAEADQRVSPIWVAGLLYTFEKTLSQQQMVAPPHEQP